MKKWLLVTMIVLFVVVFAGSCYGAYYYQKQYKAEKNKYENLQKEVAQKAAEATSEEDADASTDSSASSSKSSTSSSTSSSSSTASSVDTSGWLTYTNTKYGFTFKYPSDYVTGGCNTKPCPKFIGEEDGGDRTMMQGDISTLGWPNIDISHLSSEYYNPPANTDFRQWILDHNPSYTGHVSAVPSYLIHKSGGGGFAAYDITIPASPQAYAQRYLIFLNDSSQLFTISLTDYQAASEDFYDAWLNNFLY